MSSSTQFSISYDKPEITKAATIATNTTTTTTSSAPTSPTAASDSVKGQKKKRSIRAKLFGSKRHGRDSSDDDGSQTDDSDKKNESRRKSFADGSTALKKSFSERHGNAGIEGLNLSNYNQPPMAPGTIIQDLRVFVGTWNVGGKVPHHELNLEDFLQVEGSSDIYVLGFQEIVPLTAGNVLVIEDNEPAAKWLALINQALNKPKDQDSSSDSGSVSKHSNNGKDGRSHFFHKPSLKVLSRNLRVDSSLVKVCNCHLDSEVSNKRRPKKFSDPTPSSDDPSMAEFFSNVDSSNEMSYLLISSKQMVGIFLTVWARKELVQHIGHLRVSCMGRGIMGCFGNKGCISISMSLHQTSLCFVCSHLASGEKEGDELKRNADVAEIIKGIQFQKLCKNFNRKIPEKILDHERIIWFGDLNYRVSLSYDETRMLLEDNDWDSILEKDQLNLEREAGRVFTGWNEGRIYFAPTYKYSQNSDSYAGENGKSKKKRRTPAWCDRILWRGSGIEQLSYIRGESRLSDHRPVCAVFAVEVEMRCKNNLSRFRKGFSCATRLEYEPDNYIPQRHSFYEF